MFVRGDRAALSALVRNLATTPCAMRRPARASKVRVSQADGMATLQVDDSGPGIPPAERERNVRPLLPAARSTEPSGTGLGLAIVRAVAAEVQLGDSPLGGLRVTLRLAAAEPALRRPRF